MSITPILAICGKSGSGKSTLANMVAAQGQTQQIALADPIKRFIHNVFDIPPHYLWGESEKRNQLVNKWKERKQVAVDLRSASHIRKLSEAVGVPCDAIHQWIVNTVKEPGVSARFLLTSLGTDLVRKYDPDAWIKLGVNMAFKCLSLGCDYAPTMGPIPDTKGICDRVIITDIRFRNEALGVMRAGGNVVKIERASAASTTPKHESEEIDIPDSWFSEIINNCGSLEDLSKQAKFL